MAGCALCTLCGGSNIVFGFCSILNIIFGIYGIHCIFYYVIIGDQDILGVLQLMITLLLLASLYPLGTCKDKDYDEGLAYMAQIYIALPTRLLNG